MDLVIGGKNQGKLRYVTQFYGISEDDPRIMPHLEERLRGCDEDAERAIETLGIRSDAIVICEEVGCGIVPADLSERVYRERVGRACCLLARQADRVHLVRCGIGSVIKG